MCVCVEGGGGLEGCWSSFCDMVLGDLSCRGRESLGLCFHCILAVTVDSGSVCVSIIFLVVPWVGL